MAGSISTLGVGSGLQLQDILDQLREVDQKVVDRKQDDITALEAQLDEFTVVNNKLLTLKSAALDLSLSGTFIERTIASSDEDVVAATVLDGATVKSTAVEVVKLAQQSSWLSSGLADKTDSIALNDSTFSYGMGDETITLEVDAGTTLQELADLINGDPDNPGLLASVIDTGEATNPYKLLVQAQEPGEANKVNLLAIPDLMVFTRQQSDVTTLDAQFKIDNVTYQRPTNTVNDVLSGVTFTLKEAGATATITVGRADETLQEKIVGLVEAYNEAVLEVRTNTDYDSETEDFGILAGTTVRDLSFELQNLLSTTNVADSEGLVTSLFSLGLEVARDGTITINETTLSAAISTSHDSVRDFFLGDSDNDIEGFADTVNNRLRTITGYSGIMEAEKSAAQLRIDDLESLIEEETGRLERKYENLTRQFVQLDQFMSKMTSMSNFLTGQFDNLSNGWSGGSGGK